MGDNLQGVEADETEWPSFEGLHEKIWKENKCRIGGSEFERGNCAPSVEEDSRTGREGQEGWKANR